MTAYPTGEWITQAARNVLIDLAERGERAIGELRRELFDRTENSSAQVRWHIGMVLSSMTLLSRMTRSEYARFEQEG